MGCRNDPGDVVLDDQGDDVTAQQDMEKFQRELRTLGLRIADALGITRLTVWLSKKLETM